ncbi:NUDIX hydrolase [Paenibacillus sp. J2TS4]|uniref:NUDIX hydrolase n=1 Tax=Paenibacillus sp. J2TS4 TaxID=2807194 RepID=UPI001B0ECE66|nr:NUDIX domain-containing protein [Paenibacillus sp. J2TS4]GIP31663.1 DNA mismatch repair protein MutT [Paenibacillus sp. J2TS4]
MKYHRHLGVYGICCQDNQLLVVHKTDGPYRNRFDLPGGTIERDESIIQAIYREFQEETGFVINVNHNIGVSEFIVPYSLRDCSHIQHIAILLEVSLEGSCESILISDDTAGWSWINVDEIGEDNSSPLVQAAKAYLETDHLEWISVTYDNWKVAE